ncbi:MAG: PAS domain-containing protein, partial [Microcystaceae cyanobacterium]
YKIPIIFLSALSNLEDKVKGFHLGAVDFIPKDFHLDEIVVRIELHLKIYQLTQTLEQKNQHLQNLAQKQQEMALALKSSEEMFMTAFHCSPDPIVIIALQTFHILEANASFSELIGYPLSHILGKVDLELNFWADFQQRTLILQMTKAHQLLQNQEVLFLNHQQELQYILLSSKLITFNQQEAVLLLPKNITDQKN